MARMHSGARGRSGSKKPLDPQKPAWLSYQPKEVEMLVTKLAKEGNSASKIGLVLRDRYGIPSVRQILGKKVDQVLAEKGMLGALPDDMMALIKKAALVRKHLETNKKDTGAVRGLQLTESKIRRLSSYHKKAKRIPVEWKYNPEEHKAAAQ